MRNKEFICLCTALRLLLQHLFFSPVRIIHLSFPVLQLVVVVTFEMNGWPVKGCKIDKRISLQGHDNFTTENPQSLYLLVSPLSSYFLPVYIWTQYFSFPPLLPAPFPPALFTPTRVPGIIQLPFSQRVLASMPFQKKKKKPKQNIQKTQDI